MNEGIKVMSEKAIIWLEDQREQVADQIEYCEKEGIRVSQVLGDLAEFNEQLEEFRGADGTKCMIIADILLYGVKSLRDLNINIDTEVGYEAGWLVVERFLRGVKEDEFGRIPVLILSSRPMIEKERKLLGDINRKAQKQSAPPVKYLTKGGLDSDSLLDWQTEFETIIQQWLSDEW